MPCLPGHVNKSTKKDQPFNDLIVLLENTGKKWHSCNLLTKIVIIKFPI